MSYVRPLASIFTRALMILSDGQAGSGKSYTLLQAVQYARSAKWLVMYIPRGMHSQMW